MTRVIIVLNAQINEKYRPVLLKKNRADIICACFNCKGYDRGGDLEWQEYKKGSERVLILEIEKTILNEYTFCSSGCVIITGEGTEILIVDGICLCWVQYTLAAGAGALAGFVIWFGFIPKVAYVSVARVPANPRKR